MDASETQKRGRYKIITLIYKQQHNINIPHQAMYYSYEQLYLQFWVPHTLSYMMQYKNT